MKTFFAINRHNKTVVELKNFACWEAVQGCFRVGIQMPDGTTANGIGRCSSTADLAKRAAHCAFTLLQTQFGIILAPQPLPSVANLACIECGKWSASGGPRCEDCQEEHEHA